MTTAIDARAAQDRRDRVYRLVRAISRFWLWFFFKSVPLVSGHPPMAPVPRAPVQ